MRRVRIIFQPVWAVVAYYFLAVLRPQALWPGTLAASVGWSRWVALAAMSGLVGQQIGLLPVPAPKRSAPAFTATHWAVLAFAAWVLLSYAVADLHYGRSDAVMIEYLKIFAMFVTATFLIRSLRQVWTIVLLSAAALGYVACQMDFCALVWGDPVLRERGFDGLDNNGAALLLAMGVPLCLCVWEGAQRWWRWLFLALLLPLIYAVLTSQSRGALVALAGAGLLLLVRSRRRGTLALGLAAGAVLIIPFLGGTGVRERLATFADLGHQGSLHLRYDSWRAGYRIANDFPILGVGVRNADFFSYSYGADRFGRTIHSVYLQIAADNGWIGLGLYLIVLATAWVSLRRTRRLMANREGVEGQRAYALACGVEASLIAFWIGAAGLSLETVELPYLLILLGAQLPRVAGVGHPTMKDETVLSSLQSSPLV